MYVLRIRRDADAVTREWLIEMLGELVDRVGAREREDDDGAQGLEISPAARYLLRIIFVFGGDVLLGVITRIRAAGAERKSLTPSSQARAGHPLTDKCFRDRKSNNSSTKRKLRNWSRNFLMNEAKKKGFNDNNKYSCIYTMLYNLLGHTNSKKLQVVYINARHDHLTSSPNFFSVTLASMPKRKAQPSGLNKGGGNFMSGSKKPKPNRKKAITSVSAFYNVTKYSPSLQLTDQGRNPWNPLYVLLTQTWTTCCQTSSLFSDDEDEDDPNVQADDEGDGEPNDDPDDLEELTGLWDNGVYADAFRSFCATNSIPTPPPRSTMKTLYTKFEDYCIPRAAVMGCASHGMHPRMATTPRYREQFEPREVMLQWIRPR
ncbi:hypothetical protein B0H14DRAFT_2572900 [Mycena olivaceomarginata]|nr:hypothetical protein B0H14DRAFT_2572900 [Mycena olivaceomarginata]